jgi:transposase InsO family protein
VLGYKSRNVYYKQLKSNAKSMAIEQFVIEQVKKLRISQSRVGTRKIYRDIKQTLEKNEIKIGRDKLFKILKNNDLLIKPKKNYTKTTNSYHHFYKHKNTIKNMAIDRPEKVWVADITYIKVNNQHAYLFLITDAYSRKIVGWNLDTNMRVSDGIKALNMAVKNRKYNGQLYHHSDRGFQYCNPRYIEQLQKHNIIPSMTDKDHVYQNSLAERVNGILKQEFDIDIGFNSLKEAQFVIKYVIDIYNKKRRHTSLNYLTPNFVHLNPILKHSKKWGQTAFNFFDGAL